MPIDVNLQCVRKVILVGGYEVVCRWLKCCTKKLEKMICSNYFPLNLNFSFEMIFFFFFLFGSLKIKVIKKNNNCLICFLSAFMKTKLLNTIIKSFADQIISPLTKRCKDAYALQYRVSFHHSREKSSGVQVERQDMGTVLLPCYFPLFFSTPSCRPG